MATSPRPSIDNELASPRGIVYHRVPGFILQGSLPSVCTALSVRLQSYLSCLVPSSHLSYPVQTVVQVTYYIHTFIYTIIHSYINTFTYSHIHAYTHHINSHMIASVTQSLVRSYLLNSVINSFKW